MIHSGLSSGRTLIFVVLSVRESEFCNRVLLCCLSKCVPNGPCK
jgi:hypothetical protein